MKQIKISILPLLILCLTACEKQLQRAPINNLSAESFYANTADFDQAVNAAYRALNGYDSRLLELSEVRSDNVYITGIGPRDYSPIANFDPNISSNANVSGTWNADYNGIMRTNVVLDKINATLVPDAPTKNRMEGEVRFIRAFLYFDLVRWFGKVPLITKVVSRNEALEIPRSPVADVYALIISDLQTAAMLLPASYTGLNRGRATSWAAKALLAQVYLTRSGPQLHPDGPCLGLNEYQQALALLNEIINSKQFSLQPTYASVFSYTNEYNSEIIFDIEAANLNLGGLGTGLPGNWYEGDYGTTVGIPFSGGVVNDGLKEPSRDLVNSYEAADKRYLVTILPSYTYQGNLRVRPQYIKFLDLANKPTAAGNWAINFPVLRYADILLMKAEAIVRGGAGAGGTQADADAAVKLVRDRAGLTGTVLTNVTLDQVLLEARHEFASEGRRWHELVRTGKMVTVMNAWKNVEDQAREKKILAITNDYIIYPIPATEISVNPKLTQNQGYK